MSSTSIPSIQSVFSPLETDKKVEVSNAGGLAQLPNKVLLRIFEFLSSEKKSSFCCFSKYFFRVITEDRLHKLGLKALQHAFLVAEKEEGDKRDAAFMQVLSASTKVNFNLASRALSKIKSYGRYRIDPFRDLCEEIIRQNSWNACEKSMLGRIVGAERVTLLKLKIKLNEEALTEPELKKMTEDIETAIKSFGISDLNSDDEAKPIVESILLDLIETLIKANHLQKAEELAAQMKDRVRCYSILPSIAVAYGRTKQSEKAEKIFQTLNDHIDTDQKLQSGDDVQILIAMAKAKASMKETKHAEYIFRQAQKKVSQMNGIKDIQHFSTNIADAKLKAGIDANSENLLKQLKQESFYVDEPSSLYVIQKLAENGFFKEAFHVAVAHLQNQRLFSIRAQICVAAMIAKNSPDSAYKILRAIISSNKMIEFEQFLKIALAAQVFLKSDFY